MRETIFVLSPGRANPDGGFADYGDDGSYIGGQIRMNAAVQMIRDRPEDQFFLVGGLDTDALLAPYSQKAQDMSRFICSTLQDEEPEVWHRAGPVPSLPCTYHNFIAALRELNDPRLMEPGTVNIGVLTNAYHIPRSQLFATQAKHDMFDLNPNIRADVTFTWHAAEDILQTPMPYSVKDDPEAYAAFKKRIAMEERGLLDIDLGRYDDSCRRKYREEEFIRFLVHHGKDLMAEHEFEKWGIYAHVRW